MRVSRTKERLACHRAFGWKGDSASMLRIMGMGQLVRFLFLPSVAKALISFSQPCQVIPGTSH